MYQHNHLCNANCTLNRHNICAFHDTSSTNTPIQHSRCPYQIPINAALKNVQWHSSRQQYSEQVSASNSDLLTNGQCGVLV